MSSAPPSQTLSLSSLTHVVRSILLDPSYFWILAALVTIGDAVLTQLIIRFVSYTEIDWETYMLQVELYIKGERDYALIEGPTGPLVYPAGHVYVHHWLYRLTDSGTNIVTAQQLYGLLYIVSLLLTCAIYRRAGNVPNWIIMLLPLSKRLHSIFALRLFNDCWAVVGMQAATLAYAEGLDDLASLLFSAALSIKMSILLYLPGVLVVQFKRRGLFGVLRHLILIFIVQLSVAAPFLQENPRSYFVRAFDLSRVFFYKWTVNWRFLDEDVFLSKQLANVLLLGHLFTLAAFGAFRWCRRDGGVKAVVSRGLRNPARSPASSPVTADYVVTVLYISNLIGILFARSLHYQFYSWYAQQVPFLAWRTRYPFALKFALLAATEYAWNVFPSTVLSSGVLVGANMLLLGGIWFGYAEGMPLPASKSTRLKRGER